MANNKIYEVKYVGKINRISTKMQINPKLIIKKNNAKTT